MEKKTEQSRITYNKMALEYDSSPEGSYTRAHKAELIKKVVVKNGDTILDVACGNGFLLAELSKKAKVNALGVDISENMIAVAKKHYPNITFLAQPCFPLSLENMSINVITVSCAFHHFEQPQGFADECMRILKNDGVIYMAEPYFSPLIRWIANMAVFPFSHNGDVRVYSSKELSTFFKTAGFTKIQTYIKDTILFFEARK
ncbi:class I SAM-dependent methyltransferase [Anaerocolumna sp. MB42-C2]|uniref:class I SAM-dependent methyltransferase n=1 Tax=Anaerocolumna sp. MB42-C2 TaxID=3070997 RepID=UPI0027E1AF3C|nr:class I SAM-dependent methyltransferase [Anaerocolumna sp. MB42-C2]WMJ85623.1 class I SAM-dependent methyltransferase [Anaerocolumna sp. MB42-C2]